MLDDYTQKYKEILLLINKVYEGIKYWPTFRGRQRR